MPQPVHTIMGVLNVTPDSFSDGGRYVDPDLATAHAIALLDAGAGIVDVGGESTRPGAEAVAAEIEIERVTPAVERLHRARPDALISVDTSKLAVARRAVAAGARYVNDVTALRSDPDLAGFVADHALTCCLMHMRGEPRTMQDAPVYDDVVDDVRAFLEERMEFAMAEGIAECDIHLDPGIGFGKTTAQNLALLARLAEIVAIGRPVVIGVSRKRFIGDLTGAPADTRVPGTVAANVLALARGASIFRVHDVHEAVASLAVAAAILAADIAPTR